MNPDTFKAVDPHLDSLEALADQQFADPEFRRVLAELSQILGQKYGVSISLIVEVCDATGERSIPWLNTGLCAVSGKPPFRTSGDSTPQRYVVEEGIQVVPHDRCPKCWHVWDFKWKNPACSHCGTRLGENCKILLDSEVCPFCEEGKVTVTRPCCDKCGHEIDSKIVVWG